MPAYDAKTQAIVAFLQAQGEASPELAADFAQMQELYSRKLWHQLTVLLESLVAKPGTTELLAALYDTFITDFKSKLNKLALARLQIKVAQQYDAEDQAAAFGSTIAEEARKDDPEACAYILSELARLDLGFGKVKECKEKLDEAAGFLDGLAGVELCVQAAFYRAWSAYYKIKGPAAEFYKNALLLLAYAPLSEMSQAEGVTISFDLGIAALVGENLYNFGELLEHPVVSVLEQTEYAWLANLLRAFNAGDINQYEMLVAQHHEQLAAQPALLANTNFLKEKITLMCLTETLFKQIGPAANRTVDFSHIAAESKLPVDQAFARLHAFILCPP